MQPAPTGHSGHGAVAWQLAQRLREVEWLVREQRRRTRHQPTADRWIRRGIAARPVEVRHLVRMRVHGDAPRLEKILQRADVIEVTVRENDRFGWRVTKPVTGGAADLRPCGRQS